MLYFNVDTLWRWRRAALRGCRAKRRAAVLQLQTFSTSRRTHHGKRESARGLSVFLTLLSSPHLAFAPSEHDRRVLFAPSGMANPAEWSLLRTANQESVGAHSRRNCRCEMSRDLQISFAHLCSRSDLRPSSPYRHHYVVGRSCSSSQLAYTAAMQPP